MAPPAGRNRRAGKAAGKETPFAEELNAMSLSSVSVISNTLRLRIVSAKIAVLPRILQIAFSLVLGSVPIAFAQINRDHPNGMQVASGGCGPEGDSAGRCVSVGDFTNQHLTFRLLPAPESDPDPRLNYSMPPSPERGVVELSQPSLTSRAHLADPALTASPQGWRIGGVGVLNYTARNRRWRFVVGYAPDLDALLEKFGDAHSFNLAWQYSLGKHKPASWAGVKAGSEYMRRPAPR